MISFIQKNMKMIFIVNITAVIFSIINLLIIVSNTYMVAPQLEYFAPVETLITCCLATILFSLFYEKLNSKKIIILFGSVLILIHLLLYLYIFSFATYETIESFRDPSDVKTLLFLWIYIWLGFCIHIYRQKLNKVENKTN